MKFQLPIRRCRDVWKTFDRTENLKKWQPTLKTSEHVSGTPGQPGAISKLTYEENGRQFTLTERITHRDEPSRFDGIYVNAFADNEIRNTSVQQGADDLVPGHTVTNRSHALEALAIPHDWEEDVRRLYHTGTENIQPNGEAKHVDKLLGYLDESVALLRKRLDEVSEEYLAQHHVNYRGDKTREVHLSGFHWHETYHIGRLEIFRAMALSRRS